MMMVPIAAAPLPYHRPSPIDSPPCSLRDTPVETSQIVDWFCSASSHVTVRVAVYVTELTGPPRRTMTS